jgi:hypothetical protein
MIAATTARLERAAKRRRGGDAKEGTVQAVIAAALPPTLGAQSAAIANQPFIMRRTWSFGTLIKGRKLIDTTR